MSGVALWAARRFRPAFGWVLALLAWFAALCSALAASESNLGLPTWWFVVAGVLGFGWGVWVARPRRWPIAALAGGAALLVAALALVMLAIGEALPPSAILARDAAAWGEWLGASARANRLLAAPESLAANFLRAAVPRFWRTLLAAPGAGENGARLLVSTGGVLATCAATLALGWATATRRSLLTWCMPLVAVLAAITVLGGGNGGSLAFGLALALALAIVSGFRRAESDWQRGGVDYSDQIERDVWMWGGALAVVIVSFAAVFPAVASTPLAELLWGKVELPSAIAVLDRNGARPPAPAARIALSNLPAIQLGVSLERGTPETVALRVRLETPPPASPSPRYWRARLLNVYDGRQWWSNARIEGAAPQDEGEAAVSGAIVQEIEDLRAQRDVLIGMPNLFSLGVPAQAERLPDGTLAAVTSEDQPRRYRVVSLPQERAAPPPPTAPPDVRDALAVPKNVPPRVAELAQTIAGSGTQAEQALALETYLRALPYSYTVRPLPNTGEAVDQFLFEMREGYCTYYASAMAVMARTLGIPARVGVGYATGSYDETTKTYTVRESDAHAWPELYIGGRWTAYEPTPIRPLPNRGTAPAPPVEAPAAAEPVAPALQPAWPALGAMLILLTLLGTAFALRLRQQRAAPVALALAQLEQAGAKAGMPWPTGATLREYGATLEPRLDGETRALHRLIELVERARYRGETLHAGELEQIRASSKLVVLAVQAERRPK